MAAPDIARLRQLRDTVAVVGVGETDYRADYRTGARGNVVEKGAGGRDPYLLGMTALRRALDDAGIAKDDIDGLWVSGHLTESGACLAYGIDPNWTASGDAARGIAQATMAIASGLCTTVALVYSTAQRSFDVQYGGPKGERRIDQLEAPWGMTSLGAYYAQMFQRHADVYSTTEEQLGAIAVAFRRHASMNEQAIMRQPLTIEDYLNTRYIAAPLRLPDYSLINDAAVAIIVQRADIAQDARHAPVSVSGFAWNEMNSNEPGRVPAQAEFWAPSTEVVRETVYGMSGLGPADVDLYGTYDSFSIHLLFSLEGFGFCAPGDSGAFVQGGRIEIGGELPTNTSGGMLSESATQGWTQHVELVRQLRGGLNDRQVEGAEVAQYAHNLLGKCLSVIYTKRT